MASSVSGAACRASIFGVKRTERADEVHLRWRCGRARDFGDGANVVRCVRGSVGEYEFAVRRFAGEAFDARRVCAALARQAASRVDLEVSSCRSSRFFSTKALRRRAIAARRAASRSRADGRKARVRRRDSSKYSHSLAGTCAHSVVRKFRSFGWRVIGNYSRGVGDVSGLPARGRAARRRAGGVCF